jgi:hypothetical protein
VPDAAFIKIFPLVSVITLSPIVPLAVNFANLPLVPLPPIFAFQVEALEMYVSPIAVPCQTPVPIVPNVVMLLEPAQVDKAVY